MKIIVRKDIDEDWNRYLTRLMKERGLAEAGEQPSVDELRRFDKTRNNKTVSNDERQSPTDPDSCLTRMKGGTTHLPYKAERVVDLDTEIILAAEICHATQYDTATLEDNLVQAQVNQQAAGSEQEIEDAAADKGYHNNDTLTNFAEHQIIRTCIPEQRKHDCTWADKPPEQKTVSRFAVGIEHMERCG